MSIRLVVFSQSKAAQLLSAHLNAKGIKASVSYTDTLPIDTDEAGKVSALKSGYQILLENPQDGALANDIAQDFINNPNQAKFQNSAWEQGEIAPDNEPSGSPSGPVSSVLALYEFKQTPFTFVVLAICTIAFVLSSFGYFGFVGDLLEIRSLSELSVTHEWWRLVGPNFLHFSIMHIAFNLLWWWMLGRQLEISFGSSALIIFFVIASLFSNVAQLLVSGPNFGGLSGIVYALVGFVWWIGWLRPAWLISLPKNVIYFLLVWLVIGYFDVLWVSMANEAHTFGLISGCLMALLIHLGSPKQTK